MYIQTPTLIQAQEVVNGGVIKATPMNPRFDAGIINPHILDAEMLHVVPMLGSALYETMKTKKAGTVSNYNGAIAPIQKAFTNPLDTAYEALWYQYLNTYCAWAVYYEALPFITIQTGVNGTFLTQTEFSQNPGVSAAKYLQDNVKRRLQSMRAAVENYLCENFASFPDFDNTHCPNNTNCEGSDEVPANQMKGYGLYYVTNN